MWRSIERVSHTIFTRNIPVELNRNLHELPLWVVRLYSIFSSSKTVSFESPTGITSSSQPSVLPRKKASPRCLFLYLLSSTSDLFLIPPVVFSTYSTCPSRRHCSKSLQFFFSLSLSLFLYNSARTEHSEIYHLPLVHTWSKYAAFSGTVSRITELWHFGCSRNPGMKMW